MVEKDCSSRKRDSMQVRDVVNMLMAFDQDLPVQITCTDLCKWWEGMFHFQEWVEDDGRKVCEICVTGTEVEYD